MNMVEGVDLTTGPFIFHPEQAFRFTSLVNNADPASPPMKIEAYTIRGWIPRMGVTAEKLRSWRRSYGVEIVRIHPSWMASNYEMWHQTFLGNWYQTPKDQFQNVLAMRTVGPATNEHGLKLAESLGVGVNLHPNVVVGLEKRGILDKYRGKVPFILGENSVYYNSPELHDQGALGNPLDTISRIVLPHKLDGFLFAIDHLMGISRVKKKTESERDWSIRHIRYLLEQPSILSHTWAIHLADTGHELITGDKGMAEITHEITKADFSRPVRVALDFNSNEFTKKSDEQKVDYIRKVRDKILDSR